LCVYRLKPLKIGHAWSFWISMNFRPQWQRWIVSQAQITVTFHGLSIANSDSGTWRALLDNHGRQSWGEGWGDASPQFLEWGDEYLIIPPPHFLTCLMKFCFLVV
jgi:hypothetical protein